MRDDDGDSTFLTKRQYVAQGLRRQVVDGVLPAGTRILPQEIAKTLKVSATPVREAIQQLQTEGYLEAEPHSGTRVIDLRNADFTELYELRVMIETALAAAAAKRIDADDIATMRAMNVRFRQAADDNDIGLVRGLNQDIHQIIWRAAGRPITESIAERLWNSTPWELVEAGTHDRMSDAYEEHVRLFDALEAHDTRAVERAMKAHVKAGESSARQSHQALRGSMDDKST